MTDTPTGDLSPEASELLGQAAEPIPDNSDSGDHAVQAAQAKLEVIAEEIEQHDTDAVGGTPKLVPVKALQGEAENTRRARAALEQLGYREKDGMPVPIEGELPETESQTTPEGIPTGVPFPPQLPVNYVPQPSAQPQAPRLVGLATRIADATGGDIAEIAQELQGAFFEVVAPVAQQILGPLTKNAVQMNKARLAQADPDFPIYEQSWEYWNNEVGGAFSGDPLAAELARRLAVADHIDEISEKRAARKNSRVVGKFVEGAMPSSTEGNPPSLPPELDAMAREMNIDAEGRARIAQRREARQHNEGWRSE